MKNNFLNFRKDRRGMVKYKKFFFFFFSAESGSNELKQNNYTIVLTPELGKKQ